MACDQIQGFLYSPALPAIEVARYLAPQGGHRPPIRSSAASSTVDRILAAGDPVEASRPGAAWQGEVRARAESALRRSLETRTLVIDDERSTFGQVTLRMMRLGADVHLVQGIDEASVFVEQDEPELDLVVIAPSIDLRRLAVLREQILKTSASKSLRILVVGEAVDAERRQNLREVRVDWLVTERVEDVDLRFFIGAARSHTDRPHDQRAVRVPLETTAWIRANGDRRIGTLTSLSRRGAFIETADPYAIGQSIRLEFKVGTIHIRAFANVSYQHEGGQENSPYRPAGIGVAFYESDDGVTDEIDGIIEQIWARHRP
jgi:Tfp pilus assembly protein PilZ